MKKPYIFIAVGVALAAAVLYLLYRKGQAAQSTAPGAAAAAATTAPSVTDSKDIATFKKLVDILKKYDAGAMNWLVADIDRFNGGDRVDEFNPTALINGKKTLSGAFMSSYGASYWPQNKNPQLNKELSDAFTEYKLSNYK